MQRTGEESYISSLELKRVEVILKAWACVVALMLGLFAAGAEAQAVDKSWAIDHVLGRADAPITIIEYSSLTCSYCARFYEEVHPRLKEEWIDTGKAKLIFRDFPLDSGALAAALIAQSSGDRYFAFLGAYFKAQHQWTQAKDPLAAIKNIGRLGGLDAATIDAALANRGLIQELKNRKQDGVDRYHIEATPSFIINGKLHTGGMSYDEFVKLLK
ncbi:MAG: thioredoxin domain-containing protein [Rhodospirillaceae bacterium]|nr:thioredoxin domain-containing protein [Rhodospirillaceae bacterium]